MKIGKLPDFDIDRNVFTGEREILSSQNRHLRVRHAITFVNMLPSDITGAKMKMGRNGSPT